MASFQNKTQYKKFPIASGILYPILTAALVFLAICFNNADTTKVLTMILMIISLSVGIIRLKQVQQQMNSAFLMLILIAAMGCVCNAYAISGKFALQGALYLMTALCISFLLMTLPTKCATPGRFMATALAGASSLLGLVSMDYISTRLLSTPVLSFLGQFTDVFDGISGVEEHVRLTSILDAPNVFAGCVGIGLLLSLMLTMSAPDKKERQMNLVMLYINALAFLLSFSMGATISIAAAIFIYILLERKHDRYTLVVLLGLTALTVLVGIVPISMTALDGWDGFQPVPLLALAAGAALLCVADFNATEKLSAILRSKGIKLALFGGITVAVLAGFVLTACLWTGDISLSQGDGLRRAVYPDAGSYTVSAVGSGNVGVTVESQNRQEAMMHTSTILYSGELQGATFTVPEDSLVVYFNLHADSDAKVERITYAGSSGSGLVPLDYKLLPDFIANRLQGFFANQNVIQRMIFFSDGLKIFSKNPVLGQGLGSFEATIFSVQSFYYETKYVHNHYIQTMLETGIIGLLLFVGLIVLCMVLILRSRKKEDRHPFVPALGALVMFMAIHAAVEVVFSSGFYLPLAFGVFTLIGLCCGDALSLPKKGRSISAAAVGVMLLTFTILLGCNLKAAQIGSKASTMKDFQRAAELDPFEWTDYALSYISSAPLQTSQEVQLQAEEYVQRLDREHSNTIHYHLARYCFQTGQMERGMEMAKKQAKATISSSQWWNKLFLLLYEYDDGSEAFNAGIHSLVSIMDEWNEENMGQILLDDAVLSYVREVLARSSLAGGAHG